MPELIVEPGPEPAPVTDAERLAEPERWKDWCRVAEPGETVPITPDALLLIILCLEQAQADRARYQERIGKLEAWLRNHSEASHRETILHSDDYTVCPLYPCKAIRALLGEAQDAE
ncbi:hypothetical protein LCGC14_2414040 [marine sediment metagenome]|uniref:Uncharacterized protein n=1 Tax=marine sediment metagenome TaxID=412755 RepID=A0A0F9EL05_9ZZZZ